MNRLTYSLLAFALVSSAAASHTWDGTKTLPVHKVQLKDEDDRKIIPGEERPMPFSARTTCGACHDYKKIGHGWHFSPKGDLEGRATEPWVIVDEKTGTQLPLSLRKADGLWSKDQLGLSDWDFTKQFARHMPGGGAADKDAKAEGSNPRWAVSGNLEINCLACHNVGKCQDMTEWVKQVSRENYRWAATAAAGLGEVEGVAERLPSSWIPSDGINPDDMVYRAPPSVNYRSLLFDSKSRAFIDIDKPTDSRCLQCHSVAEVGKKKEEVTCDVHSSSGMSCVSCHRNGIDHNIVRGNKGMYSCEGCHMGDSHSKKLADKGGAYGAPVPEHKGLPPVHLEKMTCTACHSGALPKEGLSIVRTSKINRLGVFGRAQWFTEAPVIVEPVFKKNEEGKIAPHRMMWPSFWAKVNGDKLEPVMADEVIEAAGDILDPQMVVGNMLARFGSIKNKDGDPYGKAVFHLNGKLYERNMDGGLDLVKYDGPAVDKSIQLGFIMADGKVVDLIGKFTPGDVYAFYSLDPDVQAHTMKVLSKMTEIIGKDGGEAVWIVDRVMHKKAAQEFEDVPMEEAVKLKTAYAEAKKALDESSKKYGIDVGPKGKQFFKAGTTKRIYSIKKEPNLKIVKKQAKILVKAEKAVKALIEIGPRVYRETAIANVVPSKTELGPEKGVTWGALKDGKVIPLVSSYITEAISKTHGKETVALTETQVAMALTRLGSDYAYIAKGKMFKDAGGKLTASDHEMAAPVAWPIAHDVRPAAQSLGSVKCTDCHSAKSDFFFAEVAAQGPLMTDQGDVRNMSDFMEINGGFNRLFGFTFIVRPLFKLFLLGMAGITGLVVLAYLLLGLTKMAETLGLPLIDKAAAMFGCLSGIILTVTGFGTAVCVGKTLSGYSLLIHTVFGALFALCCAVLVVLRANKCKLVEGKDDEYSLVQKVSFWVLIACGIVLVLTILAAMVPVLPSHSQHCLLLIHRVAAIVSVVAIVLYLVKRKKG